VQPQRLASPAGESYLDRWRSKWTWDYSVRGTHFNNCAYQAHCAFDVFVKDGRVVREEQVAAYPGLHDGIPDANPRGYQKGCQYSELMYGDARVTRPLKRKGKRGDGDWEEISWEQALGEIADKLLDVIVESGPDSVVMDIGSNALAMTTYGAALQLADAIDCSVLDITAEMGDDMQGAALTYGAITMARSADEYFHSDLIVAWSGNPAYTQIPNFHYLTEARYHGAKVVLIAPDYNASAMHADLFVPVRPGTDTALALAMARLIIEERRYDEALLREQTDMPILVRVDNKRFLRKSDLVNGGSDETLYWWDAQAGGLAEVPTRSLALGTIEPALEGTFEVETHAGPVKVQPVFERLKTQVAPYTPEAASKICGTPPSLIRKLAEMMAEAKAAMNVETLALGKFYHGDAMMRSQILVFVLCGHLGKKGAGWNAMSDCGPDGLDGAFGARRFSGMQKKLLRREGFELMRDHLLERPASRGVQRAVSEAWADSKAFANATLFWNIHGGVIEESTKPWDTTLPRDVREYLDEAIQKGWQSIEPPPDKEPRAFISMAGNVMRRVRASHKLREVLWPKLDLVVVHDVRMSSTAHVADYFLPVAGFYEKPNSSFFTAQMLQFYAADAAVAPVGDSKDEWEIAWLLGRELQERAKARGLTTFVDRRGERRRFADLHDVLSFDGQLGPKDAAKLSERVVDRSTNLGGVGWDELKKRGYVPVTGPGRGVANAGSATEWTPRETATPFLWHTRDKMPWATFTGRVQFYFDHAWYLELGEELPAFKEPPKAGGEYPLVMTGGHGRWSIHALQRTDTTMLRLQRGEPCMYVSQEDARARQIEDWDLVEVFNDVGRFRVRVKPSASIRPGQVVIYHAWEDFQFEGGIGYRNVSPSPINPLELVGGYPFLDPSFMIRQPGMNDRDTRVEMRKV
jgi:DMSO reductase family type II enzyme molybdopterin subunit